MRSKEQRKTENSSWGWVALGGSPNSFKNNKKRSYNSQNGASATTMNSSSKPKSGVSETPKSKVSVSSPSPRLSKSARGIADHSPKPRASPDRPNPKPASDKPSPRTAKGSSPQSQLNLLQDELNKAKDRMARLEKEKANALEELKEAQKVADGLNEKLRDALAAQKCAEDNSEVEKFRAIELEQVGIDATRKEEEEWQKELEAVRNQHASDVATLESTTGELQVVQRELALAVDAKAQALIRADDAARIADINSKKNEDLSAEISRLKGALDSKLEREADENSRMVLQPKEDIAVLRLELERYKGIEEKSKERDVSIECLNVDLEAAKAAEAYAHSLVEEWKSRVEGLEKSLEVANQLERSASESLDSLTKQLEGRNDLLHNAEAEISDLKKKVASLETTAERRMRELEEAGRRLAEVEEEFKDMEKVADALRSDLDAFEEEKSRALDSERAASSSVQSLLEEKARLVDELKISNEEEEKSKKAMESIASALHEVSAEARDAKEKLVCIQIEHENCEAQLEDLRLVLKATNEKYEVMLYDAKAEMESLASAIEQSKYEQEASKVEWEQKELHLVDCVKRTEQEKQDLQSAKEELEILLRQAEEKAADSERQEASLRSRLKESEDEVVYLQGVLGEVKGESMKWKEGVLDKENELQVMVQENEELRAREASSLRRIEELSKLLEEAASKVQAAENGDLSDCEEDYDLLPGEVDNPLGDGVDSSLKDKADEEVDIDGKSNHREDREEEKEEAEREYKMWESCKIEKKELSAEVETEQVEELKTKADGEESLDQENGRNVSEHAGEEGKSPSLHQNPKKKKPLLHKFGSLLKKKGGSTPTKQKEEI